MTVAPLSGHTPLRHPRLDRAAVGVAAVAALMFACGMLTMSRQGLGGALLVLTGMVVSVGAFAMALTAKLLGERWAWLWFPLLLVPAFTLAFSFVPFVLFTGY